jgi:hypothetical protein
MGHALAWCQGEDVASPLPHAAGLCLDKILSAREGLSHPCSPPLFGEGATPSIGHKVNVRIDFASLALASFAIQWNLWYHVSNLPYLVGLTLTATRCGKKEGPHCQLAVKG